MSLTGLLARRDAPLRERFENELPNLKPMQAEWRVADGFGLRPQ